MQGPGRFVRDVMALAPHRRQRGEQRHRRRLTAHEKIEQRVRARDLREVLPITPSGSADQTIGAGQAALLKALDIRGVAGRGGRILFVTWLSSAGAHCVSSSDRTITGIV